jgi:hypothetical protein
MKCQLDTIVVAAGMVLAAIMEALAGGAAVSV